MATLTKFTKSDPIDCGFCLDASGAVAFKATCPIHGQHMKTRTEDFPASGYTIESEDLEKLRRIEQELHGGTDRERDYAYRIWLVLNNAQPIYNLAD